jgi:formylglycine-generating enzyme
MKRITLLAVIGLGAALFTGCGKDSGNNTGGIHDTLTIYYSDTTGYTLTPSTTAGGTISPAVPVKVDSGDLHIFIVKPDSFYWLDSVTADNVRLQAAAGPAGYTVYVLNVSKDMAVKAWFSRIPIYYGKKLVPAGSFLMGRDSIYQTAGAVNKWGDIIHQVTLSAFYMDSTDVTQADYTMLMGCNPSGFTGDLLLPVETVTWFDAVLYCNARSKFEGKDTVYSYSSMNGAPGSGGCTALNGLAIDYTRKGYRLPTDAEYEYACRGGTTTNYWWGADTTGLGARTWWYGNSSGTKHVATKLANGYGLYDMTGNVWEWCNDWYGSYGSGSATDPTGPSTGTVRVIRGGSWFALDHIEYFHSAYRGTYASNGRLNHLGFRCVLPW